MNKPNKLIDILYLTLFGLLLLVTIYDSIFQDFIFGLTKWAALILWFTAVLAIIFNFKYARYGVIILLGLSVFNIIIFTTATYSFSFGNAEQINNHGIIGFNLYSFVLLIIYLVINGNFVFHIFRGSEEDIKKQRQAKVNFYYEKFEECSEDELNAIFKKCEEYPLEAQIAIDSLKNKKDAGVKNFEKM